MKKGSTLNGLPEPTEPNEIVVYYWGRIISALVAVLLLVGGIIWGAMGLFGPDNHQIATDRELITESLEPETPAISEEDSEPPEPRPEPEESVEVAQEPLPGHSDPGLPPAETAQPESVVAAPAQGEGTPIEEELSEEPALPERQPIEAPDDSPVMSSVQVLSKNLARAQLSSGLAEKEPVDRLPAILHMGSEDLLRVFLFTEIHGMKGQRHYHDWYLNDERVARVPIQPFTDSMRASSAKFIDRHMLGDWRVEVVSQANERLAVGEFSVQ